MLVAELVNLAVHLQLRFMRPAVSARNAGYLRERNVIPVVTAASGRGAARGGREGAAPVHVSVGAYTIARQHVICAAYCVCADLAYVAAELQVAI